MKSPKRRQFAASCSKWDKVFTVYLIFNSHLCFVSTSDKALNGLRSCLFWRDTSSSRSIQLLLSIKLRQSFCHFASSSDKALNGPHLCLFWRDTGSMRGLSNFRFIYTFSSKTQNIYLKKPYCRVCVEWKSTFEEFEPIDTAFIIHKITLESLCHFASTSDKALNGPYSCLFWFGLFILFLSKTKTSILK